MEDPVGIGGRWEWGWEINIKEKDGKERELKNWKRVDWIRGHAGDDTDEILDEVRNLLKS